MTFELWCGQEKGVISVLEAKSMRKMRTLPVLEGDLSNPALRDLNVTFLETARSYDVTDTLCDPSKRDMSRDSREMTSSYVWTVVYPGTTVSRWNVDTRLVEEVFDAQQHPPLNDCKYFSVCMYL